MAAYDFCLLFLMMFVAVYTKEGCGPCDPESCARPRNCLAGMVKDHCDCCMVCGRIEGEKCDNDSLPLKYEHVYGYCGEHLECRIRSDLQEKDAAEAICFCKQTEILCASDGKTYNNICQMMEEAYKNRNGLKAVSRGPCKSVPWVVSGPESQSALRGSNVALSCEGMGFPIPAIEWQLTRKDGVVVDLPSDDQHIAVQTRGGPEKFEVTAWLQILDFQDEDIGSYHCIVRNAEGDARAMAFVKLVETAEEADAANVVDIN